LLATRFLESRSASSGRPVGRWSDIAYNAFLAGKSLLGMCVTDVLQAVRKIIEQRKPKRLVVCGRRDAALLASFAAAVESAIDLVATEEMILSSMAFTMHADRLPERLGDH
jgi:hypothetical protein